jgi:hypothetical protein
MSIRFTCDSKTLHLNFNSDCVSIHTCVLYILYISTRNDFTTFCKLCVLMRNLMYCTLRCENQCLLSKVFIYCMWGFGEFKNDKIEKSQNVVFRECFR